MPLAYLINYTGLAAILQDYSLDACYALVYTRFMFGLSSILSCVYPLRQRKTFATFRSFRPLHALSTCVVELPQVVALFCSSFSSYEARS